MAKQPDIFSKAILTEGSWEGIEGYKKLHQDGGFFHAYLGPEVVFIPELLSQIFHLLSR